MRTMERRDELVRLLRRRADWTVAGLARELEVSRRTVLRDLSALRDAGFDIDTFSGPGGGVRLNPTSVLVTSQLRASEVVALILSAEIARATKTVPFAAGAEIALTKIEQALPRADRCSYEHCGSGSWWVSRSGAKRSATSTRTWWRRSRRRSAPPASSPSPTATSKADALTDRSSPTVCSCANRSGT